jgi:hypothetical protein
MQRVSRTTQLGRTATNTLFTQTRSYAKQKEGGKINAETGRDDAQVMEAMKDYMRPTPVALRTKKPTTPQIQKHDHYLSSQFSQYVKYTKKVFLSQMRLKREKQWAAVSSLPEELRREAAKTDWDVSPHEFIPPYLALPMQPKYDPPLEILHNEL